MTPLRVGHRLIGFCHGAFGRDSYGEKIVEALGADWVVARNLDTGEPEFYVGDPDDLVEHHLPLLTEERRR